MLHGQVEGLGIRRLLFVIDAVVERKVTGGCDRRSVRKRQRRRCTGNDRNVMVTGEPGIAIDVVEDTQVRLRERKERLSIGLIRVDNCRSKVIKRKGEAASYRRLVV